MNISAQLLGACGMLCLFLTHQQKSRKKILLSKLSADVFWLVHYVLLGGTAGAISNAIGLFRELVFINRRKKAWASSVIWPIIFVVAGLIWGAYNCSSWYNVLPILSTACATIALWIDNPRLTKIVFVPISIAFLIYNSIVASYTGIANEIISLVSIATYFLKQKTNTGK